MALYTLGHKIPDSDSIIGAISLAYLHNKIGVEAIPARQGEPNPETKFILGKFGLDTPMLKEAYAGEDVFLIDYSDVALAPDDISEANVLGIVDHHKLGDLTTSAPLECWIRPVGCSNTIVKEMYDHHKVEIPKEIAGAMMCAILSDTVIFKSPTYTETDKKAVLELASIAGIEDFAEVGMEMFRVKSAVDGTPARELVKRDFKGFDMYGKKIGIGQLEVVDGSVFDPIKDDLIADMKALKEEEGFDEVLLLLTDIMKEGSEVLACGDFDGIVEKSFDKKLENSAFWLDGCLSRKKQIIPFLEPSFK